MKKYILRRFLIALPVLFLISVISFTFIELAPGDAVGAMMMQSSGGGLLVTFQNNKLKSFVRCMVSTSLHTNVIFSG